jgi:hypothetical protein
MIETRKSIEKFVQKQGMKKAVQKYGIQKLMEKGLIYQYEGTKLYYGDNFSVVTRVYNEQGVFLGHITPLMSPYYKELGLFFGPCLNGNTILYQVGENGRGKTYGVVDKNAKVIVPFGKYNQFEFLPQGVALMSACHEEQEDLITIHYDGTVKVQPFMYIEKIGAGSDFELKRIEEEKIKTYIIKESVINNMMSKSTEVGKEKGIE